MTKHVTLAIATLTLALSFSTPVMANEQLAQSLCNYTAVDNKNQIRKTLSDNRLRLRNIYDGVYCNGDNLVRHAIKSQAADAASFIVSQLPASQFQDGADLAWAEEQGFGDSPAVAALKHRIDG